MAKAATKVKRGRTAKPKAAPTAKATKTKLKPAPKARGRQPSYKIGDSVEFKGYIDEQPDPLFQPGDILSVVEINEDDGQVRLGCVTLSQKEAYEADPESVDGDELLTSEVKRATAKALKVIDAAPEEELKDVGKMPTYLKQNKGDLAETARELLEDVNRNYFYFGGLLAHIRRENLYASKYSYTDEKTGFSDFCENELGIGVRKARYWEDIYVSFSRIPKFSEKLLSGLGWSKAAEVARYVTEDNANELVERAKQTPIAELKETLKEEYVTEGQTASGRSATRQSKTIKRISFDFKLFEDQAEGVRMALEAACKKFGLDMNQMFEHIVMEWAAENLSDNQAKAVKRAVNSKRRELKKAGVEIPAEKEKA